MSPQVILILGLTYLIGMPILLRLICFGHKRFFIDRKLAKMPKNKAASANLPKPIWPKIKERLSFTRKDKRPLQIGKKQFGAPQNRIMMLILWAIGLICFLAAPVNYALLGIGVLFFFISIIFSVRSAREILETREKIYRRMFEIGSSKGVITSEHADNPQAVIRVLEWDDYVKPKKVEYDVRTEFAQAGEEAFLLQFNQIFGNETSWIPVDDPEKGTPGWNYDEGKVTLGAVPPLPTSAPWDEHYVIGEGVAWSFFPIGLGVEGGLELLNPKTGEMENVLGFDLSGEQAKVAKDHGLKLDPKIVTSPMCFTGDTKVALANNTFIPFKELTKKSNVEVLSFTEDNTITIRNMTNIRITRKNAKVVKVIFDNNGFIKCTPDHLFRLEDGTYKKIQSCTTNDKIISFDNTTVKVSSIEEFGYEDVYDAFVEDLHNFGVLTENANSVVAVHNCFVGGGTGGGKSLAVNTIVKVLE